MITYILRRCVQAIPVLFGITLFTFLIAHLVPGDPVQAFAGDKQLSPELAAQIRQQYGLDKPLWQQYLTYMDDLVHGDMGAGLHNKRPVTDTIREAIGPTLQLTLAGLMVALTIGVTFGVLAAIYHNTWIDSAAMVVALLGVSLPVFYLGLIMLFIFSFRLSWFPSSGLGRLAQSGLAGGDDWHCVIRVHCQTGAELHAGGASPGLHPDRPREGPHGALGHHSPCAQECAHPDGDLFRHTVGRLVDWRGGDRDCLLPSGAGPGGDHGHWQSRLSPHPGHRARHRLIYLAVSLVVDLSYGFLDPRIRYD